MWSEARGPSRLVVRHVRGAWSTCGWVAPHWRSPLALWLPSTGVVGEEFVIRQGTVLGRRGMVRITREHGRAWVAGDTVVGVTGTVDL